MDYKFQKKQILYTLLLLGILFIPNLYVLFYFKEISGSLTMLLAYFVISIVAWCFPLVFLRKKIYFSIAFIFLLFSPLEIVFVRNLGIPMTEGFIESVFRTNYLEATEQITSNLFILFLFLTSIGIYIFLFSKIKNSYLPKKLRLSILLLFLAFNSVLILNMYRIQVNDNTSITEKFDLAIKNTESKYRKTYPTDLVINVYKTINNLQENKILRKQIENFTFNAKSNNNEEDEEIFLLVIGETARYANFQINGYERNTTPHLDTINNILSFSDVYSSSVVTTYSIPTILTRATPHNLSIQNKEKTVLDAFKEAGYFTAYFANQNSSYPVTRRLINIADVNKTNFFDVNVKDFFDGAILPHFENVISTPHNKKFILIHTLGSHFRYTSRYPKELEKFTPVMNEFGYSELNFENKERVINAYDNSILYTDFFLSQLIENLKSKNRNTVLLYLSDHGENLFDDEQKIFGHGTVNPTKYEYHIPFLIWFSDEYETNFPNKINALKENLDKAVNMTSTFYTLLDMANIDYDNSENEKIHSLSSEKYSEPNERFILNSDRKVIKIKD